MRASPTRISNCLVRLDIPLILFMGTLPKILSQLTVEPVFDLLKFGAPAQIIFLIRIFVHVVQRDLLIMCCRPYVR